MEIKALSTKGLLSNILFRHTIKFMSYNNFNIVIVTKYNEIYILQHHNIPIAIEEDKFEKINLLFNITHLACNSDNSTNNIMLINENNELFLKGCFYNFKCNKILGSDFLFILTNDNKVYGFGNNYKALGINRENNDLEVKNDWTEFPFKAKDISCSDGHSILLDLNGNIYTTGKNTCGQLGLGDEKHRKKFTKVQLNFKVIKIFADNLMSFILNENNELFGCGYNDEGQLGISDIGTITVFTKINFNNCQTKNFHYSYSDLTFVTDENSNIYVTGLIKDKMIKNYSNLAELHRL